MRPGLCAGTLAAILAFAGAVGCGDDGDGGSTDACDASSQCGDDSLCLGGRCQVDPCTQDPCQPGERCVGALCNEPNATCGADTCGPLEICLPGVMSAGTCEPLVACSAECPAPSTCAVQCAL